jgi:hypothetical protein
VVALAALVGEEGGEGDGRGPKTESPPPLPSPEVAMTAMMATAAMSAPERAAMRIPDLDGVIESLPVLLRGRS